MVSTIQTGAATSVVAVLILITFIHDEPSEGESMHKYLKLFKDDWSSAFSTAVSGGFAFCLGRVYALTMLYNLNNRDALEHGSTNTDDTHHGETNNNMNVLNEICEYLVPYCDDLIIIRFSYAHGTATIHYESSVRSHTVQPSFSCQA
jgi:hypothetical protein